MKAISFIIVISVLLFGCSAPINQDVILGNLSGNISNGGLICPYSEGIIYRSEADGWKLYKTERENKVKISYDIPSSINIVDNTIYFSNYLDGHNLYKIDIDGSSREKLTEYGATCVNVVNDDVYYINRDEGFRLEVINKEMEVEVLVDSRVGGLVTDGKILYFTKPTGDNEFSLFSFNLEDNSELQLTKDQYCHYINITDEYIFYWSVNENALRRIDKDSLENFKILDQPVDYINSNEKYIYFVNPKDRYNIYRCDFYGENLEKLSDLEEDKPNYPSFTPTSIFVTNEKVYFRSFFSETNSDAISVVLENLTTHPFDFVK
ncbi:MAG: DUF5050 domain-containing protein [Clostridia bacterium]